MNPEMQYRPLGECGTRVSVFGLGGWTTFGGSVKDAETTRQILTAAYVAGVNFFDTADVYANGEAERVMGKVLREFPRNTFVLSSKVFFPISDDINDRGLSRKHIMESIDKTLKNLGTDYIDIYFCHRFDSETPIEETARAMDDLIHQGKILYWGTSEWTGAQLEETDEFCDSRNLYRPQVEQSQYSLLERKKFEIDTLPMAGKLGMGTVVWSPLASGVLTGKYDEEIPTGTRLSRIDWLREAVITPERIEKIRKMKRIADDLHVTRAQLALAWAAATPGVSSVITGATKLDQLKENLGALKIKVTDDIKVSLEKLFHY